MGQGWGGKFRAKKPQSVGNSEMSPLVELRRLQYAIALGVAACTHQQCHNVQRNNHVEPLQNGPFNPVLLGLGSNH